MKILDTSVKDFRDEEQRFKTFLSCVADSIESFQLLKIKEPAKFILSILALRALDPATRKLFELSRESENDFPTADEVIKFVTKRLTALKLSRDSPKSNSEMLKVKSSNSSSPLPNRESRKYNGPSHTVTFHTSSRGSKSPRFKSENRQERYDLQRRTSQSSKGPRPVEAQKNTLQENCPFCRSNHILAYCPKFSAIRLEQRIAFVNAWRGCTNCLREDHTNKNCTSKWSGRFCKKKHHSMLHPEEKSRAPAHEILSTSTAKNAPEEETFLAFGPTQGREHYSTHLLGTVNALAIGRRQLLPIRALLDSGSHHTFVTSALAKQLANPITIFKSNIKGLGGSRINPIGATTVRIRPFHNTQEYATEAVVVDQISPLLPVSSVKIDTVEAFVDVDLADRSFNSPGPIDVLLGIDVYADVVVGGPKKTGVEQLSLLPTVFGQAVIGKAPSVCKTSHSATFFSQSQEDTSKQLKVFWELEEPICSSHADPDDVTCEQHFRSTHSRDPTGRYMVRLPIRPEVPLPVENRYLAIKRFFGLENKLKKDPTLSEKYKDFMSEYLQLGHMTVSKNSSSYIIPHHGVWQHSPGGQKLRVVFDASCPSPKDCLNSTLLTGPKLQLDLCSILTNFRNYVIPICANLVKMYRQILVHPEDRAQQHIFWRSCPTEILKEYELTTVTYGLRPSAFLAMRVVHQLVEDEGAQYPFAASRILSSMYVDDFVSGANTVEEAVLLKQQLEALFSKGEFTLSKWASTLREITPLGCGSNNILDLQDNENGCLKILGLMWNPAEDAFLYSVSQPPHQNVTKRIMLSAIARIFDPLGLLAPVVFQAKVLIQELWKHQLDWDDPLPPNIEATWTSLIKDWYLLSGVSIPRYFGCYKAHTLVVGFCDASGKRYAAVAYLRVQRPDGSLMISLIKSKTKVAPLKFVSTARLELCGALLLSKLIPSLGSSVQTDCPPVCFSDSSVALSWIRKPVHLLKVFEANRVSEIQRTIPSSCWKHIESRENPADLASRGCSPQILRSSTLWWEGPTFLKEPIQTWSVNKESEAFECLLATQTPEKPVKEPWDDSWMKRFSNFGTLVRTAARILRLRRKEKPKYHHDSVTAEEFHHALLQCVKCVQRAHFPSHLFIKDITPKEYSKLLPFIDDCGVVRVGGRLDNSPLNYSALHPMLLPPKSHFSQLLIEDIHKRHYHAGPTLTLALPRNQFWIPGGLRLVRNRVNRCVSCRILKAKPTQPPMASLPEERFHQFRAFTHIGVDYAGPFFIKDSKARNATQRKSYSCIFVCLANKAVHLEAVTDLTTVAFLSTLDRFISRRGLPKMIHSDHGSNFIGASRYMKDLYTFILKNESVFVEHLAPMKIDWTFTPPLAPHFGGLWEAGVKSVKGLLTSSVGKHPLTFEELSTAFARIEGLLNSRPLCALDEDVQNFDFLTPGHLVTGGPLFFFPDYSVEDDASIKASRWGTVQREVQFVWNKWRQHYLHTLQQRNKCHRDSAQVKPGDLVILNEKRTITG